MTWVGSRRGHSDTGRLSREAIVTWVGCRRGHTDMGRLLEVP